MQTALKSLQELNSKHGVTHNNTSSAFTLPSEFKKLWDELVTELILDAFPDFLDSYKQFVCLVQELFIVVRQLILDTKFEMVLKVATQLNLIGSAHGITDLNSAPEETKQVLIMLEQKLQGVFKDYNTQIFEYSQDQIKDFIEKKYKPRCEPLLEDDDTRDMFEENVDSADFVRFIQAIVKLQLHMVLNDPPIQLSMQSCADRVAKAELTEKYDFWMFNKNDYYCIDGFPKEGYPCVVVLPPPYRQGYVYQGIKPAVIVLADSGGEDDVGENLMDHVHAKQQAVLEKLKQKRASSLATVKGGGQPSEKPPLDDRARRHSAAEETETLNVKKVRACSSEDGNDNSVTRKAKAGGSEKEEDSQLPTAKADHAVNQSDLSEQMKTEPVSAPADVEPKHGNEAETKSAEEPHQSDGQEARQEFNGEPLSEQAPAREEAGEPVGSSQEADMNSEQNQLI